jgi:hypothetical protein
MSSIEKQVLDRFGTVVAEGGVVTADVLKLLQETLDGALPKAEVLAERIWVLVSEASP